MKIKLSKMTGKLKNLDAINTNTVTNKFCKKMHNSKNDKCICKYCYSQKMLKTFRKNCQPAFQYNSNLLSKQLIDKTQIPRFKHELLRINAHGELINQTHADNIIRLALFKPDKTITLYTKRLNLINNAIKRQSHAVKPDNLIIVYSNPLLDKPITKIPQNNMYKYVDKIFNVMSTENNKINCGAKNCNKCRLCYNKNNNTNIIYEMVR